MSESESGSTEGRRVSVSMDDIDDDATLSGSESEGRVSVNMDDLDEEQRKKYGLDASFNPEEQLVEVDLSSYSSGLTDNIRLGIGIKKTVDGQAFVTKVSKDSLYQSVISPGDILISVRGRRRRTNIDGTYSYGGNTLFEEEKTYDLYKKSIAYITDIITNHCPREEMKLTFLCGRIQIVQFDSTHDIFTGITYAGKMLHNKEENKNNRNQSKALFLLSVNSVEEENPYCGLVCPGDLVVSLNDTTIDNSQELESEYGVGTTIHSVSEFETVVSSILPPATIVLTFLRQRYDFVEAGYPTKMDEEQECREQNQGQIGEEEEEDQQQGHLERSVGGGGGGEGESVSATTTLPAPPVSTTTTTTVNNNNDINNNNSFVEQPSYGEDDGGTAGGGCLDNNYHRQNRQQSYTTTSAAPTAAAAADSSVDAESVKVVATNKNKKTNSEQSSLLPPQQPSQQTPRQAQVPQRQDTTSTSTATTTNPSSSSLTSSFESNSDVVNNSKSPSNVFHTSFQSPSLRTTSTTTNTTTTNNNAVVATAATDPSFDARGVNAATKTKTNSEKLLLLPQQQQQQQPQPQPPPTRKDIVFVPDGTASASGFVTGLKLVTGREPGMSRKYSRCLEGNIYFSELLLSLVPQYNLDNEKGIIPSNEMKMIDDIMNDIVKRRGGRFLKAQTGMNSHIVDDDDKYEVGWEELTSEEARSEIVQLLELLAKHSETETATATAAATKVTTATSVDISILTANKTVATTVATITLAMTTTMVEWKLAGYPISKIFVVGYRLWEAGQEDPAIASYKRGAENDGCVPCMAFYVATQDRRSNNNAHFIIPWLLELAIRGHINSISQLVDYYNRATPQPHALINFWIKMMITLGDTNYTHEQRIENKKKNANICITCGKEDMKEKMFKKCGICKYYSYCSKACQAKQWTLKEEGGFNHIAECRQLKILHTCCKPRHVKEIRDAIMNGVDPKTIPRLQNLRTDLRLNQPREEYAELLSRLDSEDDNSNNSNRSNPYAYLVGNKDGTVHIGSTSNLI